MASLWKTVLAALICVPGAGLGGATAATTLQLVNPDGAEVRALVIGIDDYQHVRKLKGATADARDIESSLRTMGVRDVRSLINAEADRFSVLNEISALVERTKPNDIVVLSIAGHGAQEPERIKGSQPDGMEDVFLLPGFETTAAGSQQRILGSEFNHFIRQFELRGAKILFIADTCHGGGMVREIDPRAAEMSFRQIPAYTLTNDELKPVSDPDDPRSELDLDRTALLAAVDRSTKAPEVRVPGIDGLRGALSYAFARAIEGNADADHDGKVTLKELFANVRQVVYQLSDQRQNVVTMTSPNRSPDLDVAFGLTRGVTLIQGPIEGPPSSAAPPSSSPSPVPQASTSPPASSAAPPTTLDTKPAITARISAPIRLAALDGKTSYFPVVKSRDSTFQVVPPTDNPDLIWDPVSHDVIAWGDVVAYGVELADLPTVIDRTAAIRNLKSMATQSPQIMRVWPDDRLQRNGKTVDIDLSDVQGRAVILFDVSGDGTIQMLYPVGSDAASARSTELRLALRVREPFGAEQVVAVTSQKRMTDLEEAIRQLNNRRASAQVIKNLDRYLPTDARIGSVGFFTEP
ncbi:caspase family protein [Bradyrhizobium sp.]|uniref:caspase family protein n=1 Tax=Bradyrhizobium sp. TaxID=376 RepID=UPI001EB4D93E|nr:caspase family protein [Bradyrhizobium sp.]MBV9985124.1 caspase family protein [Bradyrhizobium sp.]